MLRELGADLIPLEEVRRIILEHIRPLAAEEVDLEAARDRVLAEDLRAGELIPPFDNSAMDGFAVRSADLAGAGPERPATLPVRARVAAGDAGDFELEPGAAARILTGAPMPRGADAVVPHELTRFDEREVRFDAPARPGQNVRRAGGDIRPGDIPLRRGALLRGPQLAVAAALGRGRLRVARRPRAAIISPGNELVEPRARPGPGQIRNSNAIALAALAAESGGAPDVRGIVPDSKAAIEKAIAAAIAAGADLILTSGGVSAGDFDFVRAVVEERARPGRVFKVAMRPGKPQVFGLFDGVPLLGLPGNPAAAIVSFIVLVRPALRKMLGIEPEVPPPFPVRFPVDHEYRGGRVFLLRARVEPDLEEGGHRFVSAGSQDSSFLASLAAANAIIELPADRDRARAGEVFPAHWIHLP